ncbi:prepilin-type N-terminal cleavage/methylation domain-containing protein [Malonomonas rubra]|uniref:type IV pilus modification PilV family protein n=1 Tax=Malonomonas rubra TaxID=57040 RepID=UPI0026F1740A|nr:prepilin-type N-terminal cleavage/methylation domain-containing protein [Malonomonas rubra]
MNKTFKKSESGFSLIEVLIALFVFAVGILGMASMQLTAISGNSQANGISQSATWGADRVEVLMADDYDAADLDDTVSVGTPPALPADVDAALDDFTTAHQDAGAPEHYEIFWNVVENYPIENCKTIRIHTRRNDKGTLKVVSLNFAKMRGI